MNFCPTPSKNPTGTPGREEAQEERQKEGQLELAQSCSDGEFPGANLSKNGTQNLANDRLNSLGTLELAVALVLILVFCFVTVVGAAVCQRVKMQSFQRQWLDIDN